MAKHYWSVLLYGDSAYMETVKRKLQTINELRIIQVGPGLRVAASQVGNLKASMLITDQHSSHPEAVTKFLRKNPESPVVKLGTPTDRDLEITYQEYSRLETCGLPQVLLALGFWRSSSIN